jgi:hypothetical protein
MGPSPGPIYSSVGYAFVKTNRKERSSGVNEALRDQTLVTDPVEQGKEC